MSIPRAKDSSERILRYARYHVAAVKADPEAEHLAAAVQEDTAALVERHRIRIEAEIVYDEADAHLDRAEFELDEICRVCELEVLAAVRKDRSSDDYRAAFPEGLSAFIAARGEKQARKVRGLVTVLGSRFPEVAAQRTPALERLAAKLLESERLTKAARDAVTSAVIEERAARSELVRQLHKNKSALGVLHPQARRRVSSYFPRPDRPGAIDDEPAGDVEDSESGE